MDKTIPERKDIPVQDKWDLSRLYTGKDKWEEGLKEIPLLAQDIASYRGKLAQDSGTLLALLKGLEHLYKVCETVGEYAMLSSAGDEGDPVSQEMQGRYSAIATKAFTELAFIEPEIQAIDDNVIQEWLKKDDYKDYRVYIQKLLYLKAHILSEKEERILALSGQTSTAVHRAYSILSNVDMQFAPVKVGDEIRPLTASTWSSFMENEDRNVRERAYKNFYATFSAHENTLAALYSGSVARDIFYARARGYKSTLEAALYDDKVPTSVYTGLIDCIRSHLDLLHKYYDLRAKVLGLDKLRHYDVYVPLVKDIKVNHTYTEAVEVCRKALSPLGKEYTDTLCQGLLGGWVDRYENKGKRSGAFSSGCYTSAPYIMLNYKSDNIRDVFTIAHEGGHSMHTLYSSRNNPFMCYEYTIFEAEVASTFNEELLFHYLVNDAKSRGDERLYAWLLSQRAGDIVATLFRQTMFAEFELKCHERAESDMALTTDSIKSIYLSLLKDYFGPNMVFEDDSALEALRIPHFYNAYYVYKYATGISAALALARGVLSGDNTNRDNYYRFLKSGGSRYPIESLKIAGVDMTNRAPVEGAISTFKDILDALSGCLK